MVWDIGTYELIEGNYYKGNLQFHLNGRKLKGEWQLARDRSAGSKNWFLVKTGKSMKPPSTKRGNISALTGRTLEEIAEAKDAQWHSNRTTVPGIDLDNLPESEFRFVEPMMARAVNELPAGSEWQYEIKLDGDRAEAINNRGAIQLLSRRNNILNNRFPEIAIALESLEDGVIVDGEVVALDPRGRPNFNLLQHHKQNSRAIVYYLFDLIAYRGRDVRALPLQQRRELLNEVFKTVSEPIRISAVLDAERKDLIETVRSQGLEGIVAKRKRSRYESGERSGNWAKHRVQRGQELVVGGYRLGKQYFDNLAVGYYQAGKLIFIAKVKNGFTPDAKRQVFERFRGLESAKCPFANLPEGKNARRGEALTAEAMKNYRWLRPEVVAEIGFTDWTATDHLRHSYFIGLRDDKDARDVIKETAEN
jgi:bifunctional non-homologous end joining protein LigD